MDWQDAVQELRKQQFGWLSPTKQILPCSLHDHLNFLRRAGHFVPEIEELETLSPEAVERNCEEMAELYGDTNAEWHRLDYAQDEYEIARIRLMDRIYADGWVRLGLRHAVSSGWVLDAGLFGLSC